MIFLLLSWSRRAKAAESADSAGDAAAVSAAVLPPFAVAAAPFPANNVAAAAIATEETSLN